MSYRFMRFPEGKAKAVTFSYDDGVTQDKRLIEILNKYGLKATFNINSELLGKENTILCGDKRISHNKVRPEEVAELYAGHEVAVHTLTHPLLTRLSDDEVVRQVEEDRKKLSELVGYEVVGMAYPCGGLQNSDRVEDLIKAHTGIKYARTISLGYSFRKQENLYRYKPTAFHLNFADNYFLADEFFKSAEDGIFYIWGHSYEFDIGDTWEEFEKFCQYVSGIEGVSYMTNSQALLEKLLNK